MTMLSLKDVSKDFGGVAAVSRLSVEIAPRSITGLIGPNGAGKTTVVNLITGMLKVTSGRILLAGEDITEARPKSDKTSFTVVNPPENKA